MLRVEDFNTVCSHFFRNRLRCVVLIFRKEAMSSREKRSKRSVYRLTKSSYRCYGALTYKSTYRHLIRHSANREWEVG